MVKPTAMTNFAVEMTNVGLSLGDLSGWQVILSSSTRGRGSYEINDGAKCLRVRVPLDQSD